MRSLFSTWSGRFGALNWVLPVCNLQQLVAGYALVRDQTLRGSWASVCAPSWGPPVFWVGICFSLLQLFVSASETLAGGLIRLISFFIIVMAGLICCHNQVGPVARLITVRQEEYLICPLLMSCHWHHKEPTGADVPPASLVRETV